MDALNLMTNGNPLFENVLVFVQRIGPATDEYITLERTRIVNFNLELLGAIFEYKGVKKTNIQKVVMLRMCHFNYRPIISQAINAGVSPLTILQAPWSIPYIV